jgi:hypothetical protein
MSFKRFLTCAALALAIAPALAETDIDEADARHRHGHSRHVNPDGFQSPDRPFGKPLLAVVALAQQHVSIYDAQGKILEAPVSSGTTGRETPPGIFSIVQKEEDHHSTLYDDASMPFMERITWTGIALHAGILPGYPASHGCVRMPEEFAEKLYEMTELGMRVVIVREDIAPQEFAQPSMFTSRTPVAANTEAYHLPGLDSTLDRLRAVSRAKFADLQTAARREKDLRQAAAKLSGDAAAAARAVQPAEAALVKAEAELKDAGRAPEAEATPERVAQLQAAKSQAQSRAEAARAKLEAVKAEAVSKAEAAARAAEEAKAATAVKVIAADASERATQNLTPVSVFISRKSQRLYVRRNNMPVYESPVIIRDAGKPLGHFVFTALDYSSTPGTLRWNVVSMYKTVADAAIHVSDKENQTKRHEPAAPADLSGAQAALDRITVPEEARERLSEAVLPGSSLIISDEPAHLETGKDTDFIVVMSGEPQGGMIIRHPHTARRDDFGFSFFGFRSDEGDRSYSRRRVGGGGGGGFPFFGD